MSDMDSSTPLHPPITNDPVVRVDTWKCVVELPEPFALGAITVSHRDYVVLRVETRSGVHGVSFGLGRGAPVDLVISELLAPRMLGCDVIDLKGFTATIASQLPQHAMEGLVLRAMSHVDIAAWDIKGKLINEPVWKLLGGSPDAFAPVLLVEGYHIAGEDDTAFATRLAGRVTEGYKALKIEASNTDRAALAQRIAATRQAVGIDVDLVVDLAYGWAGRSDLTAEFDWLSSNLAWVEDPMRGDDLESLRRVRAGLDVPLAVGDEVTNPDALLRLVDAGVVDILRVDVTCVGGISGFARLHDAATRAGVQISTHVYPEIHRHVVFGHRHSGPIEMFPDNGLWDATGQLVRTVAPNRNADGVMVIEPPTGPGLDLEVDWSAVQAFAVRQTSVTK
jgi:L-alanine-DL-glutamate epimerase-like enolase superfamily enzyme